MRKHLIIFVLVLIGINSSAQEDYFRVSLSKEQILIGEQTTVSIEIGAHAADTVDMPTWKDTLIKEIEIIRQSKVDTTFTGEHLEQRVLRQNLTVTGFDSGYYAIAPLVAHINNEPIESNPFLISVSPVPIDTAKGIYDIRGIAQVPFSLSDWLRENWTWISAILLGILVIGAFVYWYYNRPTADPVVKEAPIRPAHEIALERLNELRSKQLWQKGDTKEYYSELTDILREYIELRFHIPALEQTSEEIIQSMRRSPDFDDEIVASTRRVLFLADLVKFAKEKPIGAENDTNLDRVEEFIRNSAHVKEEVDHA
ncbi:MAG: hypothetical protein Salg2KO_05180 [Salibacteraceae bacterium]